MSTLTQWEAFQSGSDSVDVGHDVLTSWRRSKWSGINPHDIAIPRADVPDDSPFHRAATPVLLRMAETLSDSNTSLALADRRGNVLWRWTSDRQLGNDLDDVDMVPGAIFDEARVGTNGIGTALESGKLAVVIGSDHYVGSFHRWACAAAPVRHPLTGKVVGVVNLTCRVSEANQFFRWAAQAMADDVSGALRADVATKERQLYDAYLAGRRHSSAPLVAVDERTYIADEISSNFGLDHRTIWRRVRTLPSGSRIDLATTVSATVIRVDEHDPSAGAVLEIAVEYDTLSIPSPPAAPLSDLLSENLLHRHLSPLEVAEYEVVKAAMTAAAGNKTAAAAQLEISRGTLYQKLDKYRLLDH
ncbi:helix-turn-helix domain-containing protein [Rhodococcus erythropolis]|uniref:helix-turn-helix domain-containing protein n=1 Tax=Rhodococcus erythropolis TaxID=1833 RepID=UPI0003076947|nr:helix-turn-helix domain-containing protein [Rhodococcus erythropolis]